MKNIKVFATALLLGFCSLCHAQQNGVADRQQSAFAESDGERTSVNIVLKSQAEPAGIKARTAMYKDKREVREMAVGELKEHSVNSQSAVLAYLEKAARSGLV